MTRRIILLAVSVFLSTGCGPLFGPGYRGEPLATLRGELTAAAPSTPKPDHLALAWMNWSRSGEWSTTQEVDFEGEFPFEYTFNVYAPPPEGAMQVHAGGRFALGGLIAYRDSNGNGVLDSIPVGQGPIDLVLGATTAVNIDDGERYLEVMYVEGTPPRAWPDARPGFNLIDSTTGNVIPLDTPIPIEIAPAPRHNLLLCQAFGDVFTMEDWNRCLGDGPARIFGNIDVTEFGGSAFIEVFDTTGNVRDAEVTLNGTPLVLDVAAYVIPDGVEAVIVGGLNVVKAVLPSGEETRMEIWMDPAVEAITAPAPQASLANDQPITVSWTPVEGARAYAPTLMATVDGRTRRRYGWSAGTEFTFTPWTVIAGQTVPLNGRVGVATIRSRAPLNGSDFGAWNWNFVPVTYTP